MSHRKAPTTPRGKKGGNFGGLDLSDDEEAVISAPAAE